MSPSKRSITDLSPQGVPAGHGEAPILVSSSVFGIACLLLGSLVALVALFDVLVLNAAVNTAATSGRMLIAVLLIVAGGLATSGRVRVGFILYAATQTFALLNSNVIAGFGVYAPAFLIAILTPILAVAMFGLREGVRLSAIVVLAWGLTAISHLYDILNHLASGTPYSRDAGYYGAQAIPTPMAWLLSLFAVVVVVIAVITAYEKQARALLAYERSRSLKMQSLLDERAQYHLQRERFMVEFSVAEFLQDIETQFAGLAQAKGLRFATETNVFPSHRIVGDQPRLAQMVSTFVSNAIEATTSGGVVIRMLRQTESGGLWRLEVKDTGPGLTLQISSACLIPA